MNLKRTERGFKRGEFADLYGAACSIQESSLADHAAIWLGCDEEKLHEVTGEKLGARMHLDRRLAKQLIRHLQRFVETGGL